jgi:hypothetical protein
MDLHGLRRAVATDNLWPHGGARTSPAAPPTAAHSLGWFATGAAGGFLITASVATSRPALAVLPLVLLLLLAALGRAARLAG